MTARIGSLRSTVHYLPVFHLFQRSSTGSIHRQWRPYSAEFLIHQKKGQDLKLWFFILFWSLIAIRLAVNNIGLTTLAHVGSLHVLADDRSIQNVKRREQRGRAVPYVVMGPWCRCGPSSPAAGAGCGQAPGPATSRRSTAPPQEQGDRNTSRRYR